MIGWILLVALLFAQGCALSFFLGGRYALGKAEIAAEKDQAEYERKRPDGRTKLNTIRIRR